MSERPRLHWVHDLLIASILTNIFLGAAVVSTYLNNVYFRLWVDSSIGPLFGTLGVIGISLGIMLNLTMFYRGIKSRVVSRLERTRRGVGVRRLTPMELLAMENPLLSTNVAENEL